jgi:hypothetical protein
MKRKTSNNPTKVYTFGLPRGPASGADEVERQMGMARGYRNDLLRLELGRRAAYRAMTDGCPEVGDLSARIDELDAERSGIREAVKARSKAERKRVPATDGERARAKEIGAEIKALRARRKDARKGETWVNAALAERRSVMVKSLREHWSRQGLYWGTYLLVEKSADQWFAGPDPSFRAWDGSGRVGVQIQKTRFDGQEMNGMPVWWLFQCQDPRLQVDMTPIVRRTRRNPNGKAVRNSGTLRFRVSSDEKGRPTWAEFPIIIHRPMPADGVIKGAWVIRRRVGMRWKWDLQIQLEAPSFLAEPASETGHTVAVDFGSRGKDSGYRVAYALDEAGESAHFGFDEIVSGGRTVAERFQHAESLQKIRDREFNTARESLATWVDSASVPAWLAEQTATMRQWRSTRRLARVVSQWRDSRFDGDSEAFALADAWRKQERHLYQWECDERRKAERRRNDAYRVWARRLAERYQRVVIEGVDRAAVIRKPDPEAEDHATQYANWLRSKTAVATLRTFIRDAFGAQRVTVLATAGRASTCPVCLGKAQTEGGYLRCAEDECKAVVEEDHARCWHLLAGAQVDASAVAAGYRESVKFTKAMKRRAA